MMSIFCLLWVPLFLLFWNSLCPRDINAVDILAVILGSIVALVQFFIGPLIPAGAFGFSRWLHIFVDLVGAPALLPLLVYSILLLLRATKDGFTGFALLWLIPDAIMRVANGDADPSRLILTPLLWTAIAVGVSFFIHLLCKGSLITGIFAALGIIALPLLATTVSWAFFSHQNTLGGGLLLAALVPMIASVCMKWRTSSL
jgi:hypothetical protein